LRALARVKWGSAAAYAQTSKRHPDWLKQVWFAGCHSDIGGSYPEAESRLSDIALDWMIEELRSCVPTICIHEAVLNRHPDPKGLQHLEDVMFQIRARNITWPSKPRDINPKTALHPSVIERLAAGPVPQSNEVKTYRPKQLQYHEHAKEFYGEGQGPAVGHEESG
jgi:hypothetical protein